MPSPDKINSSRPEYLAYLDGVRALAVMLVVAAHLPPMAGFKASEMFWRVTQAGRVGAFGVEIFFVLSGFLITRIIIREKMQTGSFGLSNFYLRRSYRIFPIYYLSVLIVSIYFTTHPTLLISLITYTFNYYHVANPTPYPLEHVWSLAVEEQFYLIWPIVMATLPLRHGRRLTQIVLPGLAVLAAIAFATFFAPDVAGALIYKSLPTRMLALSLGASIAFQEIEIDPASLPKCVLAFLSGAGLIAIAAIGRSAGWIAPGGWYWCVVVPGLSLFCFGFISYLVFMNTEHWIKTVLSWAPIIYVGRISYGIYLYHLIILYALGINEAALNGAEASARQVMLALTLTFAIAALSFRYIEAPILRRGRRARPDTPVRPDGHSVATQPRIPPPRVILREPG